MKPLDRRTMHESYGRTTSVLSWLVVILLFVPISGCEYAAQGFKSGWNEARIAGVWKFSSLEGGSIGDQLVAQLLSARLTLASDNTFKLELLGNVVRGNWGVEGAKVLLTWTEKNGLPYTARDRLAIVGNELVYRADAKNVVFAKVP